MSWPPRRPAATILVLLAIAASRPAVALDLAALTALLARQGPVQARFVEERYLGVLTRPLVTEGTLAFRPPDELVRQDLEPVPVLYTVDASGVTIAKGGDERRVALADAPLLEGLILPLKATLSGDVAALERAYTMRLEGGQEDWKLALTPRDAAIWAVISQIELDGSEGAVTRIEIDSRNGDRTIMTLTQLRS